ncbi:kynureninase [Tengunoibacter tsumagoiensis]|uniref:Kynureninase n=1 Tax=Tengunoibacter tsumagoiensis TaxID=2014871 RepID=A0A401ZVN1_9CHLR|nr:kynureninase [Tengunoibacter tsumagoiensis]GCE10965.1 kynureninase [Tengunoibacter tsumagoiensis]
MTTPATLSYAIELDRQDTLAHFRERFVIDDPDLIYMDGNSLGRLPRATEQLATELVRQQWGARLIRGWGESWFSAPERIGAKIAQLIGAEPDEVIMTDSTSVALFKLIVAALRAQQGRNRILSDDMNFPSDLYIIQGIIELLDKGHRLEVVPSPDGIHGPAAEIRAHLDEQTALLTLSHAAFKSGYVYAMKEMTEAAHAVGALVLWDLSHAVGAMPIQVREANVDLAVGCTYKYLNGGPGSPAFLYIRRDLQERLNNPITGWMGQRNLFDFSLDYQPAEGIRHFITSSPPIISLSLVEPGVDLLLEAGMEKLRAKSLQQSAYLLELWRQELEPLGFSLKSPLDEKYRGSHISLGHPEALRIDQALIHEFNVIPDFRAPDNIRLGLTPLYTSFRDIYHTVMRLKQIVVEKVYENYSLEAPIIT